MYNIKKCLRWIKVGFSRHIKRRALPFHSPALQTAGACDTITSGKPVKPRRGRPDLDFRGETMLISLNIILDSISQYNIECHIAVPSYINGSVPPEVPESGASDEHEGAAPALKFRRPVLLPRELNDARPDCLYVGRLSDAMRLKSRLTGFYCLCLRDRIRDDRESGETLSGLIIVNENLDLEDLFSEVQETFMRVNDWYQSMQEAIIRQTSIQDIITMSEHVIGNFISVSDATLSLLAYTKNVPTDDPTSLFLIANGYHSEETINKFKKHKRFEQWMKSGGLIISSDGKITKYVTLNKIFKFNDTYFTHVVMTCNHRPMTPGLVDLFSCLTHVLTYYIKRNWEEKKDFDHVYGSLIVDLLQGGACEREAVNERAKQIGIKPDDHYMVMLLSDGDRGISVFPGLMAQDIIRTFNRIRPVFYNGRLMLFLHHAVLDTYIEEQDLFPRLNEYFIENNVYCGLSEVFDDLLLLPEAYRQAELALNENDAGTQSGIIYWEPASAWSNISPFADCFANCLVDKSAQIEKIWRGSRYGKMLLDLYQSDIEKKTNNLEVLYTYLICERRATETAAALHMHRNNVVYRISRIEEMLKIRLDDKRTRLNLVMSFLMLKHSGFIREYERHGGRVTGDAPAEPQ